jgi:hypothetical protein
VSSHNRVARFPRNKAGFALESESRCACWVPVAGGWSIVLLVVVGAGCALAAIGLWRATNWGVQLAVAILFCNIIGDLVNAFMRRDYRSLVGLPIAGAMIFYLVRLNTAAKGIESCTAALINLKRVLRDQTEGLAPSKRARSEIFPRDRRKLDW